MLKLSTATKAKQQQRIGQTQ